MKEFVISDESVNRYGLRVITSGIDIKEFKKNPVMYYNHEREQGVIGRWENIRIEDNKLLATPVFDETDELGKKISGKIESGFIRGASIGIQNAMIPSDTDTITYCELIECSICDIPANKNALTLYYKGKPVMDKEEYIKLNLLNDKGMNENDFKTILEALDLSPDAKLSDVLNGISILKGETPSAMIENAIQLNIVKSYEKAGLLQMSKSSPETFAKYMDGRKSQLMKERRAEFNALYDASKRELRFSSDDKLREFFEKSFERDYEGTKYALSVLPKKKFVMDVINQTNTGERTGWTLNDYRKKAPQELALNPGLYNRLLDEQKERREQKTSN